jgi:hypothetical protein
MNQPEDLAAIVTAALKRAPEWMRSDLVSVDPVLRRRAEEALAAMIAALIAKQGQVSVEVSRRH